MAATSYTPSLRIQLSNFVLLQAAWLVAVLSAAQGHNWPGWLAVLTVLCWHLYLAPRPMPELRLIACITVLGLVIELVNLQLGWLHAAALRHPDLPAPWLIALWSLFAAALNVTLRWLRQRYWLAAAIGAVAGPLAYAGGARLQALIFTDAVAALSSLAVIWALALPLMSWLSQRMDGIAPLAIADTSLPAAGVTAHD